MVSVGAKALGLVCFILVACGGAEARPASVALPKPVDSQAISTSSTPAPAVAPNTCLAPNPAFDDPHVRPKSVDPRALAEADAASDPLERTYARGRTFFEARDWIDAAREFRGLAVEHPESELGIYAAQLYLEAINVLGVHAGRPDCFDVLGKDIGKFRELYCHARRSANEEQCDTLDKLAVQIAKRR